MAKNDVNGPVILRAIDAKFHELISSPDPTTPRDRLARVQALLLYHIIRIFDGDVGSRESADKYTSALETAAWAMSTHNDWSAPDEPDTVPTYPIATTKEFWRSWAFRESVRRTFIVTFFFLQIYRILAGSGPLPCRHSHALPHCWTLSSHLWNAADAFEFALAWRNENHFLVTNSNIDDALQNAKASDLDTFGKMLLTALLGIEETKGWLAVTGGLL